MHREEPVSSDRGGVFVRRGGGREVASFAPGWRHVCPGSCPRAEGLSFGGANGFFLIVFWPY